jgi:chorismate-pyruvate lyase
VEIEISFHFVYFPSQRYESGQLKANLEGVFMTKELKTLLNGQNVKFSVNICEEEIVDARSALIRAQQKGNYRSVTLKESSRYGVGLAS